MKAVHCNQCKHATYGYEYIPKLICAKGHKPRYYNPTTIKQTHSGDWGYKRKCVDYEEKK